MNENTQNIYKSEGETRENNHPITMEVIEQRYHEEQKQKELDKQRQEQKRMEELELLQEMSPAEHIAYRSGKPKPLSVPELSELSMEEYIKYRSGKR